jgi:glycosyltransferase involved in cell wall biosynthesis
MAVLIDATALQSEHRNRGVGAYVRHFVEESEAHDRRPHYLLSTVGPQPPLPAERTLRVYRRHTPAQLYWLHNEWALRSAFRRLRPRLFFAPDFNGLVRNPYGVTVALLHDLAELKLRREGGRTAASDLRGSVAEGLSELRWRAYYAKLRSADLLITRSESVRRDAVALLDLPPDRLVSVPQGLDHRAFPPSFGLGPYADHPPYFVHIGGFSHNKNQVRIVEAFARLADTDAHLYFAGGWGDGQLAWLESEAERHGLEGRLRHLGFVPNDDLASLYGNAVGVVFPSLEEGYGLPVLEGMAAGGPLVTSNRSSMPEVAGEAALLVDPLDAGAIADAMRRLLDDDALRHDLRRRGYAHAADFSWRALTEQTWALLDTALEAAPGLGSSRALSARLP